MLIRSTLCLTEPAVPTSHPVSLLERVRDAFRRSRTRVASDGTEAEIATVAAAADRRIADLENEVERLRRITVTDDLTGLLNRRGFGFELQRTLGLARRHGESGALLIIDLDGFKLINDGFGHACGDAVLRHVASLLTANVRATDVVARLGGDEFAVLLLRSNTCGARARAAGLDRVLNSAVAVHDGHVISIRASVGCEVYGPDTELDAVLARADAAMYRRKQRHASLVSMARSRSSGGTVLNLCARDRER